MARTKVVVWSGVRSGGRRVANAEDETLVRWVASGGAGEGPRVWFGLEPGFDFIALQKSRGNAVCTVAQRDGEGVIVRCVGGETRPVLAVSALPAALGGAARHNIANALAAGALAAGLGVPEAVIGAALASFGRDPRDNPGRLETYEVAGVRVLLGTPLFAKASARRLPYLGEASRKQPANGGARRGHDRWMVRAGQGAVRRGRATGAVAAGQGHPCGAPPSWRSPERSEFQPRRTRLPTP